MNISIPNIKIREFGDLISVEVYGMTFIGGGEWLSMRVWETEENKSLIEEKEKRNEYIWYSVQTTI